jgi:D-alanine transaminase
MQLIACVNGEFKPLSEACVHIEDRGFQFADGVYEVIACYGGAWLDLEPHLQRLARSCEAIDVPMPCSIDALTELVREAYLRNPFEDAMVYIQVTRGVAPRLHVVDTPLKPTLVITVRTLPRPSEEKLASGASGITLADIRWKRCDIKSIALLGSVMGKQEARRRGVDEAFWIDEAGHVLEGSSTNIFAVIDGVLVTHPLDHQVLGGITRDMTLRLARDDGIQVSERAWRMDEPGIRECMMSSTTNAVLPVCSIDGRSIGNGRPGPMAQRLRQLILDELASLKAGA